MFQDEANIVLLVGKKRAELDSLADCLLTAGFDTRTAETTVAAWRCVVQDAPFAIVLDAAGTGSIDAWNLCREFGEANEHLILILTAENLPAAQAVVVACGADFHIAMTDGYEQLVSKYLARQQARYRQIVERRMRGSNLLLHDDRHTSTLQIDGANRRVYRNGRAIRLTKRELALFQTLACQPDRAVPLEEICRALWETKPLVAAIPLLKQYIARLRYKIEPDPSRPIHLETVRGTGYCFHLTGMSAKN